MPVMVPSIKVSSIFPGSVRVLRGMGWIVVVATAPMVHLALARGRFVPLALGLAAVQLALGVGWALGRRAWWVAAAGSAAALLAMWWLKAGWGQWAPAVLLRVQAGLSHGLLYGGLLVVFAGSLRRGRTPLITRLARRLTGALSPERAAYTRRVTQAWCVYCAAQLAGSALLAAFAPVAVWSFFVNVLDFPLLCVMFGAEYAWRRRRFPDRPAVRLRDVLRAFAVDKGGDG